MRACVGAVPPTIACTTGFVDVVFALIGSQGKTDAAGRMKREAVARAAGSPAGASQKMLKL
jgi:hypothetical protein